MDGRPPGDRSIDPAELLRGALEKIVFFECRVSQLESELRAARQTAERARADAATSHRKAVELEAALAEARGGRAETERSAEDLTERVRLLEGERERLLSGLVDQARVAGAPGAEDGEAGEQADLAGFIAELRGELEELRRFKAGVEGDGAAPAHGDVRGGTQALAAPRATVDAIAGRLAGEGRMGLGRDDARALGERLPTASDRALFDEALDKLRAPDAEVRLRAVRRLEALGTGASAPILAAAVGREADAGVKIALLGALARAEEPSAAGLAAGALDDGRPAVRAAALDALARLAPAQAEPRVLAGLGDPSPIVRRRAALLLGLSRGAHADGALAAALRDGDAGVARAAAAALSGRPSAEAQGALARALEHADAGVRRSAAEALGRWSGERVSADAPEHERRRASRRIAERLAAMAPAEVRSAVLGAAGRGAAAPGPRSPALSVGGGAGGGSAVARATGFSVAVAVVEKAVEPDAGGSLDAAILGELRAALRGRAAADLAGLLAAPQAQVEDRLAALAARGDVVPRGPRWYVS